MTPEAGTVSVPVEVMYTVRQREIPDQDRVNLTTRNVLLEGGRCLGTRLRTRCQRTAVVVVAGDVAQCIWCGSDTLAINITRALEQAGPR